MSKPKDDEKSGGGCGCCGGGRKKAAGQQRQSVEQPKSQKSEKSPSSERSRRSQRGPPPPRDPSMELAAANLGLSKREQEQVTRALEAEMERRRRWRLLLRAKGLRRAAPKQVRPGDSKYPISIEDALGGGAFGGSADGSHSPEQEEEALAASPDMAAEMDQSAGLEEKRKEWIRKMQQGGAASPSQKKKKKKSKSSSLKERPQQPDSLSIDADTAKEIGSHTFMKMLEKVVLKAKESELEKKPPNQMTAKELIAFRRRNPKGWDALANANSIASFGLAKPTPEDEEKAQKILEKKNRGSKRQLGNQVQFDKKIIVATIPAGEDFQPDEKVQFTSSRVSFKKDALKKQ